MQQGTYLTWELRRRFFRLVCAGDMERVWADGENTPEQAQAYMDDLRRQWKALEVLAKRSVSVVDIASDDNNDMLVDITCFEERN